MADYCEPSDLYDHGLPRGAVPNPARLVESVDTTASTLALDQHGFSLNDRVSFRAEAGGSLPAPLAEGLDYYAIPANENAFSVSLTPDGSAVDLSSAGSRILAIAPLPVAAAISWASQVIDDMLPAHVVPIEVDAIPDIVRMTAAELAAGKLAARSGSASKALLDIVDAAQKRLARWGKGVPIRGAVVPPASNLAASASASTRDRSGWRRWGGP